MPSPRTRSPERRAGVLRTAAVAFLLMAGAAPPEPADVVVTGRVLDARGAFVEGATVVVAARSRMSEPRLPGLVTAVRVVTTGRDGRFRAEVPMTEGPSGERPVDAHVVAYQEGLAPDAAWLPISPGEQPEVRLTLTKAESYAGFVQDQTGAPLPGAVVAIAGMAVAGRDLQQAVVEEDTVRGTPLERLFVARTDQFGRYRFPAVPAPGKLNLVVRAEGKETFRDYRFEASTVSHPRAFTLTDESRLEGRVVSKLPGVSAAGRKVRVATSLAAIRGMSGRDFDDRTLTTDADGRFVAWGLHALTVDVSLDGPPPGPADPYSYRPVSGLLVGWGERKSVTIELVAGGVAEGAVVDAVTRAPLPGLPVRAETVGEAADERWGFSVETDERGRYAFRLPPGEWRVVYRWRSRSYGRTVRVGADGSVAVPPIEVPRADRYVPR